MAETQESTDIELIGRLTSGEEGAFLEFYRRHQGGLYRFALHMSGRPDAAADIVQETFLTLIRQSGKFDQEKGSPAAFLFGIARNHLRKLHDREGRYVPLIDASETSGNHRGDAAPGPANWNGVSSGNSAESKSILEYLEHSEIVDLLRHAVLTLPDHYREPVTLCDLQGKSYTEAASLLDCPVGTVRSRLNRARSMLLEKLRPTSVRVRALGARLGGT
jgi:RNA polymerase sigma-70 factor (ECF subfamily)